MKTLIALTCSLCLVTAAFVARGQQTSPDGKYIMLPKEQFEKMMKEHQELLDEMKEMKAFKVKTEDQLKKPSPQQAETDQALDDLDKRLKDVKQMAKDSYPGTTKFLLTGYGSAGLTAANNGGGTTFSATFNPILLWKINDRLLFEGELEAELEGHETSLALELAQISYVLNDYMTLGAGKFLNPANYFVERQHMAWVNKLPDKPLAVYDGLLPEANVGFQLRGGIPVSQSAKVGYAVYVANAPELMTDAASVAPEDLGKLEFNNFDNTDHHVAVGGRIGITPIPEFEVGYGVQYSEVTPSGSPGDVHALLQSADLSYVRESEALKGIINMKAQWVWSQVDSFTYDPGSVAGGPFNFDNRREGGYVQLAYRPSRIQQEFIKNLEFVVRGDLLNQNKTSTGVDERRLTFGLNYWLTPSAVCKVAYELDHQHGPNADPHDALLIQMAAGF